VVRMSKRCNARICDNNRLDDATVTVTVADVAGFPFSNSLDLANRNKLYKPDGKVFDIDIDLNSFQKNISFFSILGGSNDLLKISNDAIITIKANSINLFTGGEPVSVTVPVGELGIYYDFSSDTNPSGISYRYWKISIDDSLNPDDIEIAYLYLGDHVILHRNIANGFTYAISDNSQVARSDSGKIYARQRPEQVVMSGLSHQYMSKSDKDNLLNSVRRVGRHKPFIFVLDPTQENEDLDFSVKPVYFSRIPVPKQQVRDIYTSSFTLTEVI